MTSSSSRGADVITEIRSTPTLADGGFRFSPRARWLGSIAFLGVLPAVVVAALFVAALAEDALAFDFLALLPGCRGDPGRREPVPGRRRLPVGGSGPYVYPPLPALVSSPLTALPFDAAGMRRHGRPGLRRARDPVRPRSARLALLRARSPVAARDLGDPDRQRDPLVRARRGAFAWRFRDRLSVRRRASGSRSPRSSSSGPLVVWLAATRRVVGARCAACVVGAVLLVVSWAVIGFAGFLDYPELLRRLEDTVGDDSYTLYIVGLDLGLPSAAARALWLGYRPRARSRRSSSSAGVATSEPRSSSRSPPRSR